MPPITRDDMLRTEILDLRQEMRDGFVEVKQGLKGVHARQDTTNGRIGKNELSIGVASSKIKNLEREVFHRRRDDFTRLPARFVTRRDIKVVLGTLTFTFSVFALIWKLIPILRALLAAS